MKAAVLEELSKLVVKEVPTPEVDDHSALLKVRSVSICGSDIRIWRHGNPRVVPPAIVGHEASGEIIAVGSKVTNLKVGDRVALGADVPSPEDDWSRNGFGNLSKENLAIGYQIPGAFAECMLLPRIVTEYGPVTKLPDHVGFDEAALAEPLACAINGFELCSLSLGKSVVVIGLGPIGCMMLDLAKVMGATNIIAVQRGRRRLEFAQKHYDADAWICTEDGQDPVEEILRLTGGEGADVIMTVCPSVEVHEQSIDMVAKRGFVNFFGGLPKTARKAQILSNTIHYKEAFVTGSHGSTPRQHKIAVGLIAKGTVRVKPLFTDAYTLDQTPEAFEKAESHSGMKVVVHPNG